MSIRVACQNPDIQMIERERRPFYRMSDAAPLYALIILLAIVLGGIAFVAEMVRAVFAAFSAVV